MKLSLSCESLGLLVAQAAASHIHCVNNKSRCAGWWWWVGGWGVEEGGVLCAEGVRLFTFVAARIDEVAEAEAGAPCWSVSVEKRWWSLLSHNCPDIWIKRLLRFCTNFLFSLLYVTTGHSMFQPCHYWLSPFQRERVIPEYLLSWTT